MTPAWTEVLVSTQPNILVRHLVAIAERRTGSRPCILLHASFCCSETLADGLKFIGDKQRSDGSWYG